MYNYNMHFMKKQTEIAWVRSQRYDTSDSLAFDFQTVIRTLENPKMLIEVPFGGIETTYVELCETSHSLQARNACVISPAPDTKKLILQAKGGKSLTVVTVLACSGTHDKNATQRSSA